MSGRQSPRDVIVDRLKFAEARIAHPVDKAAQAFFDLSSLPLIHGGILGAGVISFDGSEWEHSLPESRWRRSSVWMEERLSDDLARLDRLAFHRREWGEPLVRRYHALRRTRAHREMLRDIERLYRWLFVPFSLWPFNVHDVCAAALEGITVRGEVEREMALLVTILPEAPSEEVCEVVSSHEHAVQRGNYDDLLNTAAKFDAPEAALSANPELIRDWTKIKRAWEVGEFRDGKGVVRRTLGAERNLHPDFHVDWSQSLERFQVVFDAFCSKWNLYGMRWDEPLLMKLTVNVACHGTMIFIPAYWSFDAKRDVRWKQVMELHGARVPGRQGSALAEGLEQRRAWAARLRTLDAEARTQKLRGAARHAYLCQGLGFDERTDPKRLTRLRKEFPEA